MGSSMAGRSAPDGEFVIGSVVNLSIRGDEARDLLDQAWTNGHMLAPFVKSLIRGSLKFGDKEIPPKVDVMRQVWSEFLVSVNGKMTGKKEKMSLSAKDKELVEDWAAEPKPVAQTKPSLSWSRSHPLSLSRSLWIRSGPSASSRSQRKKRNRLRSPALAGTRC